MIKNQYGFFTKIKMAFWLLRTKMLNRHIRLIRFPFDLRGKRYIDFGTGLTTGTGCRIEAFSTDGHKTLYFGNHVQINDNVHICAMRRVKIGDDVLIAGKVYISDNSHGKYKGKGKHSSPDTPPEKRNYEISPVIIGSNVWIGEGVLILPGTIIGRGAVIGANSIVTQSIPANTIAVGQPAKPIKTYNFNTERWEKV